GARLVDVGYQGVTWPWQVEAAIGERTAALAFSVGDVPWAVPLEEVVAIAHRRGLPVIVDAAAQLPPEENLRRFISEGADLVAFSGGKALRGPQASGFLCRRKELIQSVALNHLDFDLDLELTTPPPDLIPVNRLPGLPHHGIGRGFKVGKEEIAGLLVALRRFAGRVGRDTERERLRRLAERIAEDLSRGQGMNCEIAGPDESVEVHVRFQDARSAAAVYRALVRGKPPVIVSEELLAQAKLVIAVAPVREDQVRMLTDAFGRAFSTVRV